MLSRSQKVVAIDCQMIRVRDGEQSMLALAQVSIVDFNGVVLLDTFVSPTLPVVDYRTRVHGIGKHDLDNGNAAFSFCQTMKFISPIPSGWLLNSWLKGCFGEPLLLAILLNFI